MFGYNRCRSPHDALELVYFIWFLFRGVDQQCWIFVCLFFGLVWLVEMSERGYTKGCLGTQKQARVSNDDTEMRESTERRTPHPDVWIVLLLLVMVWLVFYAYLFCPQSVCPLVLYQCVYDTRVVATRVRVLWCVDSQTSHLYECVGTVQ